MVGDPLKWSTAAMLIFGTALAAAAGPTGAQVSYTLPTDGPLPKTYRVTLAATDPRDPNWIVSTFAAGVVRTVTARNQGRFTESWDGLDENFMPVPAGTYGLKGIFMSAQTWPIDGQVHTIVPKLVSTGSSWGQTPAQDAWPDKIEGDPVGSPLRDVDVQPDGKGVVYFQYLENGTNAFLTDFTKPIGFDQIVTGYSSGGIGGGGSACTDGRQIWILGDANGQFILHADGTPFGTQSSLYCHNVYLPTGWVTGLSAWHDPSLGHSVVFASEHGPVSNPKPDEHALGNAAQDQIVVLDGENAGVLATWKIERPLSVKVRGGRLYILHSIGDRFEVLAKALDANWKETKFRPVFTVPERIVPFDLEVDSHGRIYLSDPMANHVYQFSEAGALTRTYGRMKAQVDGAYDPKTFMMPEKLGCWTDSKGLDRLLVVEQLGPNRLSEWSGDDGTMRRQWVVPQTRANDGYAVDPRHPNLVYLPGQGDTLVRWKIDYGTGQWTADAVWSNFGTGRGADGEAFFHELANPRVIYRGNDMYLAFGRNYAIYHFAGNRWRACAAIFRRKDGSGNEQAYFWRDLNGDGLVQPEEYLPFAISPPPGVLGQYFGDTWFDDLSLVCIGAYSPSIWRLTPGGFDRRGTPLFDPRGWKKLLTDEIFVARKAGVATTTHGGNEMPSEGFDSAWASVVQGAGGSLYVDARSGPDFSSNVGGQFKLSRYDPDGKGGYAQRWRVGRMAFLGNARPGEVYGSIYVCPPVNGLVGIVDSARAGFEIYTTDGLYVDTLFPDGQVVSHEQMGAYWQPGEYFAGYDYVNRADGKIYLAFGKTMPKIYEAQGWTTAANQVRPLTTLDRTVTLNAGQIATPPRLALQIRGGPAAARVAEFSPSPGGAPALDGSMRGWENCDPVSFRAGADQNVEARCLYDRGHLYLRWHARIGHAFEAKPLLPVEHLFAHDRGNDTLGLYLQGDPKARDAAGNPGGRAGDVRFVFGIFRDGGGLRPEVLGMYPSWRGKGAIPVTYKSPVGSVNFADVGLVPGARAAGKIDDDGRGFVLAAAIPRAAIPSAPAFEGWHTEGNFDANFGGVDRFWWSNADGSASRETFDEPTEARLYPGSWSPVQFISMNALPIHAWMAMGPFGFAGLPRLDVQNGRDEIIRTLLGTAYAPDRARDWAASYEGGMTRTRAAQRKVAWHEVELAGERIDLQKALGWSGMADGLNDEGVCFFVSHIYSPLDADVTLNVSVPGGDHDVTGQLNGAALPEITQDRQESIDTSKPVALKAGWNELVLRYTYIWGENSLGASLGAPPAVLWQLKISAR